MMIILAKIFEKTRSGIGKCVKDVIHTLQNGGLKKAQPFCCAVWSMIKTFVYHLT